MNDGDRQPAAARSLSRAHHAATVLLLRDAGRGLEVFMERRHADSAFVGGGYVFPGGRVDPDDRLDEALCVGLTDAEASARLGLGAGGLAFYAAAIRECFEEAGVLFAYPAGRSELLELAGFALESRFDELRRTLHRGEITLAELARRADLRLATDRIHYWAHWITPEGQPRRFDTRFFVAAAPANQTAVHDDRELTTSAWVTPAEAIAKARNREWLIIFPTLKNLEQLAGFATTAEVIAAARRQPQPPVMQPRVLERDGQLRVVLPGDDGYDDAERDTSRFGERPWQVPRPDGATRKP